MKINFIEKLFIIMAALSLTALYAEALDYPHTDIGISAPVNCGDCHYSHGDPPWKPGVPADIDETFYNNLCMSCHTGSPGTDVKTHSSIQVDGSYGNWSIQCWQCHDAHAHEQFDDYIPNVYIETGTVELTLINTPGAGESTLRDTSKSWGGEYDETTDAGTYKYFYILIPNTAEPYYTYKIKQSTGGDLIVDGIIDTSKVTDGVSQYAVVYGRLVRGTIDAPDMDTCDVTANVFSCGSTTPKTVRYFDRTGTNSMADGNATFDGVCEVCHTKTVYNRNDNVGDAVGLTHNTTLDCTACHKHVEGFEINPATMDAGTECTNCHGFPPVSVNTLVGNPPVAPSDTGSSTPGAHNTHVNTLGFSCGNCHVGSVGHNYASHDDGGSSAVTLGFYLSAGSIQGGTYKGQVAVDYTASTTSPATTVSPDDSKTCSNVYCHSIVQSATGGALTPDTADYASPVWDGAVQCGECHKADGVQGNATTMDSGTHTKHLDATYSCGECHFGAGTGTFRHANGEIDVRFDDTLNPSGSFNQSPNAPGNGYGGCSTLFCHGTGVAASPTWGDPAFKCSDCHFDASDTDDFIFDNGTMAKISSADWSDSGHGRTTGTYDVSGNPAANLPGAASTGDPCLYCHDSTINHGDGTNPFRLKDHAEGNGWNDVCLKCHKTGATGYDPPGAETLKSATKAMNKWHDSTKYDTSPRDGGTLCFDCHDPHGDRASGTGNIMMVHNSITVNKADAYGTPGTTASPDFQDKNSGDGNDFAKEDLPSNPGTYIGVCQVCHLLTGNHRADGTGNQSHNLSNAPGCTQSGCHLHDYDSTINQEAFFLAVSGDACTDCHSAAGGPDPGTTPDAGHANHVLNAYVGKLSNGDYGNYASNNWYDFDNTSGTPDIKCGYCHPQSIGTHASGGVDLNFDPNDGGAKGTVKELNDSIGPWSSGSGDATTCTSVYCHSTGYINPGTGNYVFIDSPLWGTGSFTDIAEDRCAGCHGNSPNSFDAVYATTKLGSLSHYNTDYMGEGVTGGHFVGIHYDNIYTGLTGLAAEGTTGDDSHGNSAYSTTINCNTCHNTTVTSTANDQNVVCTTCHDNVTAAFRGNMDIDASSTVHVNGVPDVAFDTTAFRTKAQIRDDITAIPELNNSWTRDPLGYKVTNTFDQGSLSSASYSSSTCSTVACHNGYDAAWGDQKVDCYTCHQETTN